MAFIKKMFACFVDIKIPRLPRCLIEEIITIDGVEYIACCINENFTLIPYDESVIINENMDDDVFRKFYGSLNYQYYARQYFQLPDGRIFQNTQIQTLRVILLDCF